MAANGVAVSSPTPTPRKTSCVARMPVKKDCFRIQYKDSIKEHESGLKFGYLH